MFGKNKKINKQNKYIINSIFKFAPAQIIPIALNLLIIFLYVNLLSPEEYGELTLVIVTVNFMFSLFFRWLTNTFFRFVGDYKKAEDKGLLFSTTIALFLIIYLPISSIIFLCQRKIPFLNQLNKNIMLLMLIMLLVEVLFYFVVLIIRSENNGFKYSLYLSLDILFQLIFLSIIFFYSIKSIEIILISLIISKSIFILKELYLYYFKLKIKFEISPKLLKSLLKYGIPLIWGSFASFALYTIDKYIILFILDDYSVGLYSVAYQIGNNYSIFALYRIIMLPAYPMMIRIFNKDKTKGHKKTSRLISKFIGIYFLCVMPLGIVITLLRENILMFIDIEYIKAVNIIPFIVWGTFISGLCEYLSKIFELKKQTKKLTYIYSFAAVINVLLNFILIPIFEIKGAALATIVSYLFIFLIALYYSKDTMKLSLLNKKLLKIIVINFALLFCLMFLNVILIEVTIINLIIKVISAAVFYLSAILFFRK